MAGPQKGAGPAKPAAAAAAIQPQQKAEGGMVVHDYGDLKGAGMGNLSQADFAIPFLMVLQAMSPQCTKGQPEFMPEARPGMILDSVSGQLFDGEKGVILVPVTTNHVMTEWVPRGKGGGFRGVHATDSPLVLEAKKAMGSAPLGKIPVKSKIPNTPDTELVETFNIFAFMLEAPDDVEPLGFYIVPFTSTKIKKYRQQMTRLRTIKGNPPLFAHRVKLVVVPDQNAKGNFFNVELRPVYDSIEASLISPVRDGKPHPLLVEGKKFLEQIDSGAAKGAYESVKESGDVSPGGEAAGPF